jgi:septum formation inhibitor MinC
LDSNAFHITRGSDRQDGLDEDLSRLLKEEADIRQFTTILEDAIQTTCREINRSRINLSTKPKGRTVPWWTDELQAMRKRTNALRRLYQRTTTNEALRECRKERYNKAKSEYQTAIKREKTKSWKQYCTLTPANNPWNEVYKLATGKTRNNQTLTTLRRLDGKMTETMEEMIELMLEHLFPMDDPWEDTNQHKETRRQIVLPINTADDKEFTQDEV